MTTNLLVGWDGRAGSPLRSATCKQGRNARRNSADRESLVVSFGAFVAIRNVCRKAAGEGQHLAWLPGDVCAEIPGVGAREESRLRYLVHLRSPRFFGGDRRFEPRAAALAKVVQQLNDPVALKLCAGRPVGESVRAMRTVDEQEIGEAGCGHSKMGVDALRPLLPQR